jgi:hypothetical protein
MSMTMASSDVFLGLRFREVVAAGRRLEVDVVVRVGLLGLVLDGGLKRPDMLAEATVGDDVEACMWVSKADTSCKEAGPIIVFSEAQQRHPPI